jgi:hypothetical protein
MELSWNSYYGYYKERIIKSSNSYIIVTNEKQVDSGVPTEKSTIKIILFFVSLCINQGQISISTSYEYNHKQHMCHNYVIICLDPNCLIYISTN